VHLRSIRSLAATGVALGLVAVPAFAAVKPRAGNYAPKCPQGYLSICGEGGWIVASGGKRIAKNATVPWPNDPAKPSVGICGRGNPFVKTAVKIRRGKFTYHGTSGGHAVTWKGHWVTKTKVTGTVKWAGCATVAKYTARRKAVGPISVG
jgi:hypothetical protein